MKNKHPGSILTESAVNGIEETYDQIREHLMDIWPEEQANAIAKKEIISYLTKLLNEW